jgi:hypothetical protein
LTKPFITSGRAVDKRLGPISYFLEYPPYKSVKNRSEVQGTIKKQGLWRGVDRKFYRIISLACFPLIPDSFIQIVVNRET